MALTRTTAEINNDLTLRAEFRKPLSHALFDPLAVTEVEIFDIGANVAVDDPLETIEEDDITKVSTGIYEITAAKASYDTPGIYSDKWTYQETGDDPVTATTLSTVVKDASPAFLARSDATVGTDVILYIEYRKAADNTLFDPFTVDKVEILDTDGTTVLETIPNVGVHAKVITKQAVGIYYVIADGAKLDVDGTYKDKWYATLTDGAAQTNNTFDIVVVEKLGVGSGSYLVQVNVTDSGTGLVVPDLDVIASDSAYTRLLGTTTDATGKAYFYMSAGTYSFSIRDPLDITQVFSENNKTLTVKDAWKLVPGVANPNILSFTVTNFAPEWSAIAALAVTDMCAVTAKFADLQGNSLRGVVLRITNKYVPSIKSTYGIVGDNLRLVSDSAGEIAVSLVREAEVSVTIEGTGITRHVTIPDAATQDLVALVGAGADVFTIAVDNTFTIPATAV